MINTLKIIFLFFVLVFISSCSSMGVEVFERGTLAEEEMIFNSDVVETEFEDQFYHSKEGSSGGRGFSGGGCGCN